jgi:hypothetical protein
MFGADEVLVAAKQLLALPGVSRVEGGTVDYTHFLFDRHELVLSNGAETESLFTGPEALKALPDAARAELLLLFPELFTPARAASPARPIVRGAPGRGLVRRLIKNHVPVTQRRVGA